MSASNPAGKPLRLPAALERTVNPVTVTLLCLLLLVLAVIAGSGGDPLALARLGTRFSLGDPNGSEGYDGQFTYYIARNPVPSQVAALLDVPAYRYQRILLPLLARAVSFGRIPALPWTIPLLLILAQAAGTWCVAELLHGWGVSRWYAIVYGLWAGFTLAVRLDLPEPLAYALVVGAILAGQRKRPALSWVLYGLALFAREATIPFILAQGLSDLLQRRWRKALGLGLVAVLPYALFQGWLWQVFGRPGLASGGAMATPFELIPFMGLLRIGQYSLAYLGAMLVVFGPAIILPALWGIWQSLKKWLSGDGNTLVLGLLFNACLVLFLPFSTFRETGGLIRFACGLVTSFLLFAGYYRMKRPLNYSIFWLIFNVFLLKS